MTISILKDGERLARYHMRRHTNQKVIRAVKAFYKGLYPECTITVKKER